MFSGFSIAGRCYENETDLKFFEKSNNQAPDPRLALVYGRNGTGKSTISQALTYFDYYNRQKQTNAHPTVTDAETMPIDEDIDQDSAEQLIIKPHPEDYSGNVSTLVFNENYIEKNVKVRKQGLETIVLFGDQVEIEKSIDSKRREAKSISSAIDGARVEVELSEENERQAYNVLQERLKAGWAKRRQKIRLNTSATPVTKDRVSKIEKTSPPKIGIDEALSDLLSKIDDYLTVADANPPVRIWEDLKGRVSSLGDDKVLLSRCLTPPTGAGIAEIIAENLKRFSSHVHLANSLFLDQTVTHCPLCQQEIDDEYRAKLLDAISSSIDDKVTKFKDQLDASKRREIEVSGN